jgi:hypothetical protein
MTKSTKTTKKSRVKVKELPSKQKQLSGKDMKKVKGGASTEVNQVAKASSDEQFQLSKLDAQ